MHHLCEGSEAIFWNGDLSYDVIISVHDNWSGLAWLLTISAGRPQRDAAGRHAFSDDNIGANLTTISDGDFANDFRACPNHDMIANGGCSTIASAITDRHAMIEGAVISQTNCRVKDDAAKVMNPEALAYGTTSWDGNTRRDFDKPLTKKPQGLSGNSVSVAPVKKTIDQYRLKSLGEKAGNDAPKRKFSCWVQAFDVGGNIFQGHSIQYVLGLFSFAARSLFAHQ